MPSRTALLKLLRERGIAGTKPSALIGKDDRCGCGQYTVVYAPLLGGVLGVEVAEIRAATNDVLARRGCVRAVEALGRRPEIAGKGEC